MYTSLIGAMIRGRGLLDAIIVALQTQAERDAEAFAEWRARSTDAAQTAPPPPTAPTPAATGATPSWGGAVHPDVLAGTVDLVQVGADKHAGLTETWLRNWRVEGAPQPDRQSALLAAYAGWLKPWREYIRHRGGLVGATQDAILRYNLATPDDSLALAKAVAQEMASVGSLLSLPVDGFLEASMFIDPRGPLSGGPVADSADMTRPAR